MSVVASRGSAAGKTEITTAVNATTANHAIVLVVVDVTDILALVGVSKPEIKQRCLARVLAELQRSIETSQQTDATLDQRVTDLQAQVAILKSARHTGSL